MLDVGSGTGALTRVLRAEAAGDVVAVDADPKLLDHVEGPTVVGDAFRLPFPEDTFDLVICQALLINLPEPVDALREFARVSRDGVAVIEPDNGSVTVDSTVGGESALAGQAREHYLAGVDTDVTLGSDAESILADAGLDSIEVTRYDHDRTISPPYDEADVESARRKASGDGLATDRETMLDGGLTADGYDSLRQRWRQMGRDVIEQMAERTYERTETVPFYVAVGQV
ncbi:methyltransferase type 11 [Halorhabdus tiamatea SARL4B]|uniref:Methyltransferase type 11 n=1 Tax=Halorhabdus tiamatea SARL4B TaxID=1033806 RepID=S6CU82_9EURY|nr:methyltransferase type 11 [Halorhabdus tiamatea SARL4B]